MVEVMTLSQFASKHGLVTTADVDSHIHAGLRCKPQTKTYDRWNKRRLAELQAARDETVRLYREAIERGEIRDLTGDERLRLAAEHGHPDNPSVQAARRIVEKRRARLEASSSKHVVLCECGFESVFVNKPEAAICARCGVSLIAS